ncbi:hypothetical protein BDN67DRAFT_970808 [Paxillus ammoniavirescens]|nr:hypothetical protein BDN67DRAFT_970808 [Paxillus ammoniavirescens]
MSVPHIHSQLLTLACSPLFVAESFERLRRLNLSDRHLSPPSSAHSHQLPPPPNSNTRELQMPSRGRKPNPSVPPTRLLTQQRQFRARKAQLVQDLEQRCRTLEEENVQLRRELDVLAGPPCEEPSPQLLRLFLFSSVVSILIDGDVV